MKIEVEISEGAYKVLEQAAQVEEISVQEYIQKQFEFAEKIKDYSPEDFEKYLQRIRDVVKRRKASAVYRIHTLQQYILKSEDKKNVIEIVWRTCPV